MSHSPLTRERLARFRPERSTLLWGAAILNAELLAVLLYMAQPSVTPTALQYYAYPFVWINVGLWAIWRTRPRSAGRRRKLLVGGLAVAYFAVLAYAGGLVGPGMGSMATGIRLAPLPPGLGPALVYSGASVQFALLPYKVVGYVALAYLVYATALDVSGSAVSGILGLFSCVSCTWPVIASVVSGVAGSSSALAGAALTSSYGLSTVVFVVTVGLLYWRPFGDR
ncbi:DUF7546 family protein [Halococcus hamelinensis]|uniref:Uncharacterized protein n=1 Tax=Halococcus hamelinensis 100A6 TaxID=1132509 RepID=M0M134_9EURY|nr:hypothetical protein [Halococcus hamelinensis]EMA39128.1 hypothetical protein C447_07368 [Halococcus hamelinensis 100A6]